jgi:DNA-binding MarR family transcriptional regulator
MVIPETKLIYKVEGEIKKRLHLLSNWRIVFQKPSKKAAVDILATARYGKLLYRFCIEIKRAGYPQYIRDGIFLLQEFRRQNPSFYPMIIVPRIGEEGKRICDRHDVGYMDLSGNLKVAVGNVYIEKGGREEITEHQVARQSIFSPKSERITKCLLYEPDRKWTQKEVSEKSGLSKGMVSRIVTRMIEAGYLIEQGKQLTLSNFEDLLAAWLEESKRRKEKRRNYYIWAQNPQRLMHSISAELARRKVRYAFTKEAGASLVAPFSTFEIVSLYIEALDKFPRESLSASEADRGFNVALIEPRDESVFADAQKIGGMLVADKLQLYIDLKKEALRGDRQSGYILNAMRKK